MRKWKSKYDQPAATDIKTLVHLPLDDVAHRALHQLHYDPQHVLVDKGTWKRNMRPGIAHNAQGRVKDAQ